MLSQPELREYLDEIRTHVCSRCVERPPGGPPCTPLGKVCGIELHLPALIDAIHEIHSGEITPYLERNREMVCAVCPYLNGSACPCPMDYLAVLLVEAVEEVDRRRKERGQEELGLPWLAETARKQVREAFRAAAGTWTGCDWPVAFGRSHLELKGRTAAEAEAAAAATGGEERGAWMAAARWLEQVEWVARHAEGEAALAVAAAEAGEWGEAIEHARRAWALEFATGRPFRRDELPTWQALYHAIRSATAGLEVDLFPDPILCR